MRSVTMIAVFLVLLASVASSEEVENKAKVYKDAKNGYFMFLPPRGWAHQFYDDPRTKVGFNHPNASGVFIRFIVREAPGETFEAMISGDKQMSNQMKSRGISCEVKESDINGLKCSEVHAQFPNDAGTTMLRKFLSCGLHFNIQYSAPTKALFDEHFDEAMKSLETITILKVTGGDVMKAREQQIANRVRLAKLTAQWVSVEEARQILKEAQKEFPESILIQDALKEMKVRRASDKEAAPKEVVDMIDATIALCSMYCVPARQEISERLQKLLKQYDAETVLGIREPGYPKVFRSGSWVIEIGDEWGLPSKFAGTRLPQVQFRGGEIGILKTEVYVKENTKARVGEIEYVYQGGAWSKIGSVQYVQTGYPIYKLIGGNAAMLSETYLAKTRMIEADAEIDVAKLAQDDLGASIPTECTKYAEDMGSRFAIAVKGKKCDLMFQDVAYLKTDKGKHPIMILGYKGCPFSVRELKVLSDISMRERMTVEIASADGNILRAEATSALPFIVASESTMPSFMAINVQWRFATAGMSFSTTKATYKTSKSGATISFTKEGIKMDGVARTDLETSEKNKKTAEEPRTTGEVLSCVAIDYDRNTGKGSPLSTLGTVKLNEKGFIEGVKGKSGWVMINTWGNYTDDTTGMTKKVKLIGVSFWVNKGGTNWWDFEVQMVNPEDDPKENLPFETKIEDVKPGENRPVIILQGKYKLVPVGSLNSVSFQEEK